MPFQLEKRGRDWFAAAPSGTGQDEFYVGREIHDEGNEYFGIFIPESKYHGPKFVAEEHVDEIDHWAHVIEATAECESAGFMNLVNTYDRAKFSFGFYQLAAHTPQDNLVLLFRELVSLPRGRDYFPELELRNGRLHRVDQNGGATDLEEVFQDRLQFFMNYLNPRRVPIDEQEVLHAARLMHWTEHDPACRSAQARVSVAILQHKMTSRYHPWYDLDGRSDVICTIIADIHHHGRAKKETVKAALAAGNESAQVAALLSVNNDRFRKRNERLADKVRWMRDAGHLGHKVYDAAGNEFIDR